MALTVRELEERLESVPADAKLFWYTGQAIGQWRTHLRAEWHDEQQNHHGEEIASWGGELSSGGEVR